jgi:hypothetical protein
LIQWQVEREAEEQGLLTYDAAAAFLDQTRRDNQFYRAFEVEGGQ